MNIATHARRRFRLALTAVIITALLAVAVPAHAISFTSNNQTAASSGGDGGNGGIGINIVALNCFLLLVDCGTAGSLGGGNAPGGNGAGSFAFNIAPSVP
ncbi:MAG: hypothetical protein ACRDZO_09105 [Egibacteraceae bacterium]